VKKKHLVSPSNGGSFNQNDEESDSVFVSSPTQKYRLQLCVALCHCVAYANDLFMQRVHESVLFARWQARGVI